MACCSPLRRRLFVHDPRRLTTSCVCFHIYPCISSISGKFGLSSDPPWCQSQLCQAPSLPSLLCAQPPKYLCDRTGFLDEGVTSSLPVLINAPYYLFAAPIVELHHQDRYHIQLVCESTYQDSLHYHHLHHFFSLGYRRYTAGCT
jgi:hypothetical protein